MTQPSPTPTLPAADMTGTPLFAVQGLGVEFGPARSPVRVVDDVSFTVGHNETVGLVGESGSGKTVSCLAALGLIADQGGRRVSGSVHLDGTDLTALSDRALRKVRGDRIGMIFQQPMRSLDPAFTVGDHLVETLRRHRGMDRRSAWKRAVELLDRVHIADAAKRAQDYPHQFSGGMCQRVMIAVALACDPELLIADEPTTALDVTVQARILALLREIREESGISVVLISHDLGVIAEVCERVVVMYAGQVVERAAVDDLFLGPRHPYTAGLLASIPQVGRGRRLEAIPGRVPPPEAMPAGCRFHPRCAHFATPRCDGPPDLVRVGCSEARCHRATELTLEGVRGR
ncbi:ABC transporter ATP-binding protein [Pseudonocardia sp. NPDC049154]|uniref:ABC transporter ATP-binding protein n=1 Tax=Pseudonocardia sp. NPDC049154 TaxID=3155501 RepID=UPI003409B3D3